MWLGQSMRLDIAIVESHGVLRADALDPCIQRGHPIAVGRVITLTFQRSPLGQDRSDVTHEVLPLAHSVGEDSKRL
jgi:hypothetical protein